MTQPMKTITEKVVGTTFYDVDPYDIYGKHEEDVGKNTLTTLAILVKEPENPYDPQAISVYVKQHSTGKPAKIGHIGRNSEIYKLLNSSNSDKINTILNVDIYDDYSYNPKYTVTLTYR